MKEKLKYLKKIILANSNKRILVLSPLDTTISYLYESLNIGKLYNKVLDDLIIKEFGMIERRYVNDEELKSLEKQIKTTPGIPIFSQNIIDCDLILFIKIEPQVLKIVCSHAKKDYAYILKRQQKLYQEIYEKSYPLKMIEVYPKDSDLEKMSRNVYVCGNTYYYLTDKKNMDKYDYEDNNFHFPYIKQVNNIEELKRKQGFMLIINEDKLKEKDVLEIDKKYRHLFNHFQFVYILSTEEKKLNLYHLKYTNTYYIDKEFLDDDYILEKYYEYLLNSKKIKFSQNKKNQLEKIHHYLKNKNIITTNKLAKELGLSYRSVERYMNDYNKIYKTIGYDYHQNAWYIIH